MRLRRARNGWQLAARSWPLTVVLVVATSVTASGSQATSQGVQLAAELGCAACHSGLPVGRELIASRAPSLGMAGSQFRAGYLFSFLQDPGPVRPHIAASRMPAFHLDESEALALTLYLQTLTGDRFATLTFPAELVDPGFPLSWPGTAAGLIQDDLDCLACHAFDGRGGTTAVGLDEAGLRLQRGWILRHVVAQHARDSVGVAIAGAFFAWDSGGIGSPTIDGAARKARVVASYLARRHRGRARSQQRDFDAAQRRFPGVDAATGERIFRALNCAGCHDHPTEVARAAGPDLSRAGTRLQPAWLAQYLQQPHAVRPFGFPPGTGSRMPEFRLSAEEVTVLTQFLTDLPSEPLPPFAVGPLSAFARDKEERSMRERYACLGCHQRNGEGGRIGPDLSAAGRRLRPSYLRAMIADPQNAHPGGVMPQRPMPAERADSLASLLAAGTGAESAPEYLSLVDHVLLDPEPDLTSGEGLYARYCALCHGTTGEGDGYNARFLPSAPTRHADSSGMSRRPDDTLFDGIHAGGYILGKSNRMPGFGQTLSSSEIRALVGHIRRLCRCEQPEWARR